LHPSLYRVVYFPLSTITVNDFYRGLAFNLDLEATFRKVDLFKQIQEAIQGLYFERKVVPVIILDELQLASTYFLSDLYLLFNFSLDSVNPFVLILCGMPHLATKLSINHQQPLQQRLIMRYKMQPLAREETRGYLEHEMNQAGAKYPVLADTAIKAMAR